MTEPGGSAEEAALERVTGGPADPGAVPSWAPGRHYLDRVDVEMGPVTALDVVADGFDDDYQEAGALAKVRQLADHTATLEALGEALGEVRPGDEHGSFRGEVVAPEEGHATAEVRLVHEQPEAAEE